MSSKKIIIANEGLLVESGDNDYLRDHLAKWQVINGKIKYVSTPNSDIILRPTTGTWVPGEDDFLVYASDHPYNIPAGATVATYKPLYKSMQIIDIVQNVYEASPAGEAEDERPARTNQLGFIDLVNRLVSIDSHTGQSRPYSDFATIVMTEPIMEEVLNSAADATSDQQGAQFFYNYFDRDYEEELIKVVNHYSIPNLYEQLDGVDLEGTTENLFRVPLKRKLKANLRNASKSLTTQNQIVPIENNAEFLAYSGYSSFFPMQAEITVSTGKAHPSGGGTKIARVFLAAAQGVNLTRDLEEIEIPGGSVATRRENITISSTYVRADAIRETLSEDIDNVKTINLAKWIDQDAGGWHGDNPLPNNFSFIGPEAMSASESVSGNPMLLGVALPLLYTLLRGIAAEHGRKYMDIVNGVPAYSETLMFKIEKFLGPVDSITTSDPIQSFYFMNFGDMVDFYLSELQEGQQRKLKFIDTQIKYGQQYSYVVTAYQAVVGSVYTYSDLEMYEEARPRKATVRANIETVVKLIELPLFVSSGAVLDIPPLPPQIDFLPIIGSPRKLKMHFDMSSGEYDQEPISLNQREQSAYDQAAINQGRTDGLITFGSDNPPNNFQIFRTLTPPSGYEDFNGKLLTRASTLSTGGKTTRQASSATFVVKQPLNKKFYYMFRTVDYHGGLSNPSPVFEIELYGDAGVSFPIIREYQFASISPKISTKTARKIIQIVPRITQAYLNEIDSGLTDASGMPLVALNNRDIVLGIEDEPLFARDGGGTDRIRRGKRFKIRFTSKTTGKKVDLNVGFKTKRVRGQTE